MGGGGGGPAHAHRRAHRLRQDAGRVPHRHRRPGAGQPPGAAPRRHPRALRLAAQGARQRRAQEPGGAARRHRPGARRSGRARLGHPGHGAHRRHPERGARVHAPAAAAHPGDDAGVALHPAHERRRARHARERRHRDRRRDPRRRRQQARRPPRALARTPGRAGRAVRHPHRAVGDPAAHRDRRPLPHRVRGRQPARVHHRRHRPRPGARPRAGAAGIPARSGDVRRGVGRGLPPPPRPHRDPPHHARVRQHAPHGGAGGAGAHRVARRGERHLAPREPLARAAARGRAAAQGRRAQGAGGHRLAGAGDRHRGRRPRLPARLHAVHLDLPAACRAFRPRSARHPEGPAVPAHPRRARGVRRHPRRGAARRARHAARAGRSPRRAGPAGRGHGGGGGLERGRPARDGAPRLAVSGSRPRTMARASRDARRRVRDPVGPARRVPAPRRRQRRAAGPARRAPHRDDLGRRDPRQRRLRRGAGAARDLSRLAQRGLRDREPARRHLPARQHLVAHPAHRARLGPGGGRARPAAEHAVLARRGAGAHGRAVRQRVRPARMARATVRGGRRRGHRPRGPHRVRGRAGGAHRDRSRRRRTDRRLPLRRARRAGRPARPRHGGVRAVLRRERRDAARHPLPVRQPPQPRLGPRAAQALLPEVQLRAAGGGDRGRDRALAQRGPQLRARRGGPLPLAGDGARRPDPGAARRSDVRRALAVERQRLARHPPLPERRQGAAEHPAHAGRGPDRGGVPGPARVRRERRGAPRNPRPSSGGGRPSRTP